MNFDGDQHRWPLGAASKCGRGIIGSPTTAAAALGRLVRCWFFHVVHQPCRHPKWYPTIPDIHIPAIIPAATILANPVITLLLLLPLLAVLHQQLTVAAIWVWVTASPGGAGVTAVAAAADAAAAATAAAAAAPRCAEEACKDQQRPGNVLLRQARLGPGAGRGVRLCAVWLRIVKRRALL
jgi:hypothetical protein